MTSKRSLVWGAALERLADGSAGFETQEVKAEAEVGDKTALAGLEDMAELGWLIKTDGGRGRSYYWEPSGKARRVFDAYEDVHRSGEDVHTDGEDSMNDR